jgi:ribulose-phosphate 3-epimerase
MVKIAPSILSADFADIASALKVIESSAADWVHLDVMDGRFVPPITFGHKLVSDIRKRTQLFLDVHLMIEEPEKQIDSFAQAGADSITIHYEAVRHHHRILQQIKDLGKKAGISLVPSTPVAVLEELYPMLDLILIMSVNPGYGGQHLIPSCLNKITKIRNDQPKGDFLISVDGGFSKDNAAEFLKTGVDVVVSGSSFFTSTDPAAFVSEIRMMEGAS